MTTQTPTRIKPIAVERTEDATVIVNMPRDIRDIEKQMPRRGFWAKLFS